MFEIIETWVASLTGILEARRITVSVLISDDQRPNPSCSLNLRRAEAEADLVLWASGEAELALSPDGEDVVLEHLEGLSSAPALGAVLGRMLAAVGFS